MGLFVCLWSRGIKDILSVCVVCEGVDLCPKTLVVKAFQSMKMTADCCCDKLGCGVYVRGLIKCLYLQTKASLSYGRNCPILIQNNITMSRKPRFFKTITSMQHSFQEKKRGTMN